MISVDIKKKFIDFILSKSIITNDIASSFFKAAKKDNDMLENIVFSKYPLKSFKYHITFNVTKKQVFCRMNGKNYDEFRMLRYIERLMKENKDVKVGINIISSREAFIKTFETVCHNKELVEELIYSISAKVIHNNYRKEEILKEIDRALDSNDKDLFLKLTDEYVILTT